MKMKPMLFLLGMGLCFFTACGIARQNAMSPSERLARRTGEDLQPIERPANTQPARQAEQQTDNKAAAIKDQPTASGTSSLKARELISYAREFLGTPYRYAANGPDRFDCSGFTSYVYKHSGFTLPRSSQDQFSVGKPVKSIKEIQAGDLVFFARNGRVFHVGIAVESYGSHFTFIHASTSNGVIISDSDEAYWKPKYYGAKRVLN